MRGLLVALAFAASAGPTMAQPASPLAPLAFLEGCWIGTFDGPNALRDERCFEPMNNGQQLRDRHTVVGVGYGGETIYAWDAAAQHIAVVYFASDGGLMQGHVAAVEGELVMPEARYVGARGDVQRLRSRWVRRGEGFVTETEREEAGVWRPLMRIVYERAPTQPE